MNTPSMRAKMQIESVTKLTGGEVLKMRAVCKTGSYPADGADEDNTFAQFSPSATLELHVANPALFGKFTPGEKYYLDFTKAEA